MGNVVYPRAYHPNKQDIGNSKSSPMDKYVALFIKELRSTVDENVRAAI